MIEPAGGDTAALLADLHARAFDRSWSAAEIEAMLKNPVTFALRADGLGFVMAWVLVGEGEILTLAVVPEARRQGVGEALGAAACATAHSRGAETMRLEVAEDNAAARALYAKLGFEEAGRRRDYYANERGASVDAVIMRRDLTKAMG
ncbi:MAG: ribosomal protein S18-alanine N-acetyltransferase [Terricaulis sp.]